MSMAPRYATGRPGPAWAKPSGTVPTTDASGPAAEVMRNRSRVALSRGRRRGSPVRLSCAMVVLRTVEGFQAPERGRPADATSRGPGILLRTIGGPMRAHQSGSADPRLRRAPRRTAGYGKTVHNG